MHHLIKILLNFFILKEFIQSSFLCFYEIVSLFFLFLFSLLNGYFLNDIISQLTSTKSEIKNNKHITKFLRTKRKKINH
jgi:hypothetical protein